MTLELGEGVIDGVDIPGIDDVAELHYTGNQGLILVLGPPIGQ